MKQAASMFVSFSLNVKANIHPFIASYFKDGSQKVQGKIKCLEIFSHEICCYLDLSQDPILCNWGAVFSFQAALIVARSKRYTGILQNARDLHLLAQVLFPSHSHEEW
jgi:hypothetical protein